VSQRRPALGRVHRQVQSSEPTGCAGEPRQTPPTTPQMRGIGESLLVGVEQGLWISWTPSRLTRTRLASEESHLPRLVRDGWSSDPDSHGHERDTNDERVDLRSVGDSLHIRQDLPEAQSATPAAKTPSSREAMCRL
jgi:hypothetical protein